MTKKKILIITKAFYPNLSPRAFRATELALEFDRMGFQVTVFIPNLETEKLINFKETNKIIFENIGKTVFKPILSENIFSRILKRLLKLLFEYPDVELIWKIYIKLKNENGYDALISIASPHTIHWGVALALRKNQGFTKNWIADCGDPYFGCETDTFKKLFYFKYIEKYWNKKCKYITVPVESAIEAYFSDYRNKIRIIPQGFNFDYTILRSYNKNIIPTFAYTGDLNKIRNPIPFLNFISKLDLDFKFIMYTDADIVTPFVKILNGKLEVRKFTLRNEFLPVLSQMDFLVNFENPTSKQVPSKLIDYAFVNRPVLSVGKIIDEALVLNFLNGNYNGKLLLPDIQNYYISKIANDFIELTNS